MTFLKKAMVALIATMTMAVAGGNVAPVSEPVQVIESTKDFYVGFSGQAILNDRVDFLDYTGALTDAAYGVGLQAGYTFIRYGDFATAIEARYTYSWADRTLGDTGVLSGFIKPSYDFGVVTAYGLVGYSQVNVEAFDRVNDWSYGGGLAVDLNDDWEIFADYTVTPDLETGFDYTKFDNEIVTIGANYKF